MTSLSLSRIQANKPLRLLETLIRSGGIDVIVIDPGRRPRAARGRIEGEMGDSMMGVHARLMSQALREAYGSHFQIKTIVKDTNQLRQKIGVMFGNPETTTGGDGP